MLFHKDETPSQENKTQKNTHMLYILFGRFLTVGFLVASTSTGTTELLGLGPSGIGDEECAVVLEEGLLELVLRVLVNELLVVGDNRLGDGLADGVDLGNVTTTGDADTDVDTGELVEADDQEGLVDLYTSSIRLQSFAMIFRPSVLIFQYSYLEAQLLRLDELEGLAVDLDETLACL